MSPTEQENDIQELIRSIAEERRSAKEKEQRERWTRYVSLMVVVLAVATGIASLETSLRRLASPSSQTTRGNLRSPSSES